MRSIDSAERASFLRACVYFGAPAFVLLAAGEFFLFASSRIGPGLFVLFLALNVPVAVAGGWLIWTVAGAGARGLTTMLYAGGNLTPEYTYSSQESLIARGFYREAAEQYREHIAQNPGDLDARLRLADLFRGPLEDSAAAERIYLEIRRLNPDARQEMVVANTLMELYRKAGRHDRLMVELARFADRYRGTRAGTEAARTLQEMKEKIE